MSKPLKIILRILGILVLLVIVGRVSQQILNNLDAKRNLANIQTWTSTTGIDLTNCVAYFDGCNNCTVKDGKPDACTLMYCETPAQPKCTQYATGSEASWGEATWTIASNTEYWFIEWSLGYPSEWIPSNMQVCAENVSTKQIICTDKEIQNKKYTDGLWYVLKVPFWTYNVFAKVPEQKDYKAYYSKFVECWLLASCPSHDPIDVIISSSGTVSGINTWDRYK